MFSEQEETKVTEPKEQSAHIDDHELHQERKRSFRFPVIPDEPHKQVNGKKEQQDVFLWKQNKQHTYKRKQTNREGTHAIKRDHRKRFVPSRVASPIYGYNKRTDRTKIEQVPTFMRQKQSGSMNEQKEALHINASHKKSKEQITDDNKRSKRQRKVEKTDNINHKVATFSDIHKDQMINDKKEAVQTTNRSRKNQPTDTLHAVNKAHVKVQTDPIHVAKETSTKKQNLSKERDKLLHIDKQTKKDTVAPLRITKRDEAKEQQKGKPTKSTEGSGDGKGIQREVNQSVGPNRVTLQTYEKKQRVQNKQISFKAKEKRIDRNEQTEPVARQKCKEREEQKQRQLNREHLQVDKPSQRRRKQRNKQVAKQSKQATSTIPFNVMMTPADYRKLAKKENKRKTYKVPLHLLNDPVEKSTEDEQWVDEQIEVLEQTLKHFNVDAKVVHATQGPTVTRFEVKPAIGVKVSSVRNLSDDIKLNMAAKDIRIEAPIPGKSTIGIEIPNLHSQKVALQEILHAEQFQQTTKRLPIGLGLTVEGQPLVTTVAKMPHGLIAGATGSGKSVCINTILLSLIYKESYDDLKLLLIDPKMVELAPYNGIPHLVAPVITDVKAATAALKWAVNEMEERYEKFVTESVRDISRYNEKMVQEGRSDEKLPYIVIVIDELADLMMVSPQDVEDAICRIAQKARAAGMHLIIATQRPSVDVITGLIKANIPTRIAFSVSSQVDSRTILDTNGAERLLGKGDMLFVENGSGKSVRLQGAFVSDEEIDRVTSYLRNLAPANYLFEQEQLLKQIELTEEEDELFEEVVVFILEQNQASTSMLQRHFRIGYNRAARLIDSLEEKGIISGPQGSKPRQVLMSEEQLDEMING